MKVFGMCKKDKEPENHKVELKKNISIIEGVSIVVGIIVGSGIFVSPVGVLVNTKSIGLSFIMWIVTGVVSTIGAMVYAELGVTIPKSGGEYIYILQTFGPLPAFLALWITFAVIGSAACAANSLIFAEYLIRPFFNDCVIPKVLIQLAAILGMLLLCFINSYRVNWAAKLAIIFTTSKILALLLIIVFGVYYLALGNFHSFSAPFEGSAYSPGALALAFYQGFWAFSGWNYLNFLTGEVKNPARTLPIIIIISLTLVTLVYLLANVAYLAVLSPVEILSSGEGSAAVALTFATQCMGIMAWVMPLFVGASVFGSMNGEVLSMSRLALSAAEEGHLPVVLSMISVDTLTPMPSILIMVFLSICYQMYDNVFYLIEMSGLAFSVISAMAVCSLLHIRRTNPGMNKSGFKLPLFVPILYLIVDILIGVMTVYQSPKESAISIALMALGIPLYLVGVSWKNKPKAFSRMLNRLTIGTQKVLKVVQQNQKSGLGSDLSLDLISSPTNGDLSPTT